MTNARSTEAVPTDDNVTDPGTSTDTTTVPGADSAPGADGTAPAKPRRKRGPNKPKPGTFTVHTTARMEHDEIIKLLTSHAVTQLGTEVTANMTLQVNIDGETHSLGDVLPNGAMLQFGTRDRAQGRAQERTVLPADE